MNSLRHVSMFWTEVVRGYCRDNGSMTAAALSFYVLLSLVPLLLLALAVISYVLGSPEHARKIVFQYLDQYWPAAAMHGETDIRRLLTEVIRQRGAATGVGILGLLWAALSTMSILETAINQAWSTTRQRGFVRKRMVALVALAAMVVLLAASLAVTAALRAAERADVQWPWAFGVLGYFLPVVVTIGAFTLVYKVLPNTPVRLRVALAGGAFAGVLWEIAKVIFSFFAAYFVGRSRVYGSIGTIMLLAIWINLSSVVTILGARVASTCAAREARG